MRLYGLEFTVSIKTLNGFDHEQGPMVQKNQKNRLDDFSFSHISQN